jgi:hypothetical protein
LKAKPLSGERLLDRVLRDAFRYFVRQVHPESHLVRDSTAAHSPSSIAVVGFALSAYPVGVENGLMRRGEAVRRTLGVLRFLEAAPQGPQPDATGYKGFFYHFLDCETGRRAWHSELSTVDTAYLVAGALLAAAYFDRATSREREIRKLALRLYRRVDWRWACNGGKTIALGWTPEQGFLANRWTGYDEAVILYVLALGSPTHAIPPAGYGAWCRTYRWMKIYGREFLYGGPLFLHQYSHLWIDFRGIQDAFMRRKGIDYFENSRRATQIQREYARRNPRGFRGYGEHCWGITASEGPGPAVRARKGRRFHFHGYCARGVPFGPDDGTIAPWAVIASLPFAPEIVLPTLERLHEAHARARGRYGFLSSFNRSFRTRGGKSWVSRVTLGVNEGPIVLMIENYRSELVWRLMRNVDPIVRGLTLAGFRNGWLSPPSGVPGGAASDRIHRG